MNYSRRYWRVTIHRVKVNYAGEVIEDLNPFVTMIDGVAWSEAVNRAAAEMKVVLGSRPQNELVIGVSVARMPDRISDHSASEGG